jgi:YVTN family beta-propeller protein
MNDCRVSGAVIVGSRTRTGTVLDDGGSGTSPLARGVGETDDYIPGPFNGGEMSDARFRCPTRALAACAIAAACARPALAPRDAPTPAAAAPTPPPTSPTPSTASAAAAPTQAAARVSPDSLRPRLPTGPTIAPVGRLTDVGPMPLGMVAAPEGDRVVLLPGGSRQQGVQVVSLAGRVLQTIEQPSAFVGVAFSPDGRTLYASGGNQDVVYRYAWANGAAALRDSLMLARKAAGKSGTRYPAGIALSPDGRRLYAAENLADSLAVVDLATGAVVQRLATGMYPYGVAVARDGTVYVSAWGGQHVAVFAPGAAGRLRPAGRIAAGRHPSALLLNRDGTRLFVASATTDRVSVVDTRLRRVIAELDDAPPGGVREGSTPNALALSRDGTRLYVAEADANAVAVFDLSARASGVARARGTDRLAGRVPAGWYPTAVLALGDTLVVANGKGRGTAANPDGPQPAATTMHMGSSGNSTLRQISGTLQVATGARAPSAELARMGAEVARLNGWSTPAAGARAYPPITHVVYVIKENRTYDQVFGDLPEGDGDSTLLFFGPRSAPNHKALARRFGLFDRFFVNAEVSPDGHNWSTAAYTTDYLQKTVPSEYSERGRSYDYEGTNRGSWESPNIPDDDVNEPAAGYLWDLAARRGLSLRNYGEFVVPVRRDTQTVGYRGTKRALAGTTNPHYPGFDQHIPDQHRADVWIAELREYARRGRMPALEIVRLPNDHTSGARAGMPTPRAAFADNDLALGRMVEALSRSPFWRSTAMFVLEDDAQNGADHVDSHRSLLLVASAWTRPGVVHRFVNTTDVIRTIEELLGLSHLSQYDAFGRPLRGIWAAEPDLTPYTALTPAQPLDEKNPDNTPAATASARLDLRREDAADEALFNRILWEAIKGPGVPYPAPSRAPAAAQTGR